jgi:hypothetical protein
LTQSKRASLALSVLIPLCFSGLLLTAEAVADDREFGWNPGFTVGPYGWLAGLDGTLGSSTSDSDPGGGITLPPRLDVSTDEQWETIGFMFYGEWRGERWMAFFDSVWANVSQDADVKISRLLPASDTETTFDGNIYQVGLGYRVAEWDRSHLLVYGGGRYYDVKAEVEAKGGILPNPLKLSTTRSWTDAVFGGRWTYALGKRWGGMVQADYGFGDSDSVWQIFMTLGYDFSWGSLMGGYRHIELDYETNAYRIDLGLRGPLLGVVFRF